MSFQVVNRFELHMRSSVKWFILVNTEKQQSNSIFLI